MAYTGMGTAPRAAALLAALVTAFVASPSAANLISNGSFETGPAVPTGSVNVALGSTSITGWVVSSGSVDYVSQAYWQAEDGDKTIALNGTEPGTLTQSFATAPGAVYAVSFWMSGEPFTQPVIKNLRVSAAGQHADYDFDSGPAWHWAMGWTEHTWNFTAAGSTTTLGFASLDPGEEGSVLDNVVVTQVSAAGVGDRAAGLWLAPPFPDPASGPTRFAFSLPRDGRATVSVLDVQGREIARLADGRLPAGRQTVEWDGRATSASGRASGVYFVRLRSEDGVLVHRFARVR